MSGKKLLVDLAGAIRLQLTESRGEFGPAEYGGKSLLVARGEFGRADAPTQNRRMYPRKIWEREIKRIQEAIAAGKVLAELDHPADGKTSLKRVSHIITGLNMTEDGIIVGEARILDNEYGRQLKSILEGGGAVGVSSRGMGSTAMGEDGCEVVQEDYQYMTHDFVADPAVLTSYPKFTTEVRWISPETVISETTEKEKTMDKVDQKVEAVVEAPKTEAVAAPVTAAPATDASVAVKAEDKAVDNNATPAVVKPEEVKAPEAKVEEVKPEVTAPVAESPAVEATAEANVKAESVEDKAKAALKESVRTELLSDPAFAAAHIALESIKATVRPFILPEDAAKVVSAKEEEIKALKTTIESKDAEISGLKLKIEEVGGVANRLGAHLHLERKASEMKEDRDAIMAIVGKQKLESVKHVDSLLVEAKKQLEGRKEEKQLIEMEQKRLEAKYEARLKAAEEKSQKLEESLKSTVALSKEIGMKLYVSEKTRGNPNAVKIRDLCEGKTDRKEVDSIIERFAVAPSVSGDYTAIKRRFEKMSTTTLVEDQLKDAGASRSQAGGEQEGVLSEMKDLFPGASLDQVEALM